jgi:transmembrane 9 superfamily protein 2/4
MKIVFSYGVTWVDSDIAWASRWDAYLRMDDSQIHWFSIINSIITVVFLTGVCAVIMVRTLNRDIARYNEEDEDDAMEPTGWKLVHGDVFRAPRHVSLFVVMIGSGVQIFCMFVVTLVFALLGMLSPASRGALMSVAIFVFVFMGSIAGYYAARIYKTLGGQEWKITAWQMAAFFPGIVFSFGFVLNFFIWGKHSSGAVPFSTMIALFALWFGISLPLVMTGFFFGFRKGAISLPVVVNQIPRQHAGPDHSTSDPRTAVVSFVRAVDVGGWAPAFRCRIHRALLHLQRNLGKPVLLPLWVSLLGFPSTGHRLL